MSNNLYTSLSNAEEYIRPEYPGPFTVSTARATDAAIAQEKADWEEDTRVWREVEAVERALVQQIVQAVEPKYLKALRNQVTTKITKDVKGILSYLFNNYGKVPPSILKDMKRKVEDYDLDPNDPIDLLFVEIDELADIYTLQRNQLTEKQLIEIAYVVIEKAKTFKKDLRDWNRKQDEDQTWSNFKTHFRNAQQELRTSGDLTVKEAMGKDELINIVTESINNLMMANQDANKENEENAESINAMITKEKEDLKKQFDDLKQQMENMRRNTTQPFQQWPQQYNYQNYPPPPPQYNPYY